MRPLRHITTLAIAAFPAVAFGAEPLDISPCMLPAASVEAITDQLSDAGWVTQDIKSLDEMTQNHLAWMRTATYLTGDTGGQSVDDLMTLQLSTVAGIARKIDLPPAKTRVMTRLRDQGQDSALIIWRNPITTPLQVTCTFTRTIDTALPTDGPRAIISAPFDTSDETAIRKTVITKLNTHKLPTKIASVTETYWEAK